MINSFVFSIFLSFSSLTPYVHQVQNSKIIQNSDYKSLIDFINSHIENNKATVAMQDVNFDNGFSSDFIKLVMIISRYYKEQGFKVSISPTEESNIIIFSISKIVS